MKQGRISHFFKALPDKTSEEISSAAENMSQLNESDLVPGTPDSNSNKKVLGRSFFSSNILTSIRPLSTESISLTNTKASTKITPKSSTIRSKSFTKNKKKELSKNSVVRISNGFKATCEEAINTIENDNDTDIFENPPSAKRRDMKETPEKLTSFGPNITKYDLVEPLKEAEDKDRSFKAIVSKYRTRPSHSFSAIKAFETLDQDSNLEDLILEIHQDKNLLLPDKATSMINDNKLQVMKNKFKRVVSDRRTKQMDRLEDDNALLEVLLKEDAVETESNMASISGNTQFLGSDLKNSLFKNCPINPNFTVIDEDEPTPSPGHVNERKHAEMTSVKTTDNAFPDDIHKNILPVEQDAPLFHRYGRYKVISVNRDKVQMLLKLQCAISGAIRSAVLTGFWVDTHVRVDDWVNVVGSFDEEQSCTISDDDNLVVVNPDLLVTGTAVSSSTQCMRKMILSETFKYISTTKNHHLIYGTAVHAVFQEVLKNKISCIASMRSIVDSILRGSELVRSMYSQGVSECEIRCEIEKYLSQLKEFMNSYVEMNKESTGTNGTILHHHHHHHNSSSVRAPLIPIQQGFQNRNKSSKGVPEWIIADVIDIEENVWCPRLGIKGKVDATALVKLQKPRNRDCKKIIPIELKTGKTSYSAEHTGQVMLYSLMLNYLAKEESLERTDDDDDDVEGLLVYLKSCSTKLISTKRMAICGLIQLRNRFAFYLNENSKRSTYQNGDGGLPGVIFDERACGSFCDQKLNCCLYQRCFEKNNLPEEHPMRHILPATLSHLNDSHLDFFHQYCSALHLEDSAEKRRSERLEFSDVWLRASRDRVEEGLCLNSLTLESAEEDLSQIDSTQKFSAKFRATCNSVSSCCLAINAGDRVIVGQDGHLGCASGEGARRVALSRGTVSSIAVGGLVEVTTESNLIRYLPKRRQAGDDKVPLFRIDKLDSFTSLPMNLSNLSRLMANEPMSEKLRSLIIDLKAPSFAKTIPKAWIPTIQPYLKKCNKPQQSAILKALLCEDYILIKGYPGTGKTTTIATLIQILTRLGSSVLLVSYTHSAIDNVLLKLIEKGVDVLRLGKSDRRVHPRILPFLDQMLTSKITSPEELKKFYDDKNIIATTCLGTNHPLFCRRKFDYCIVDEASQSLLVSCVGPLLGASKFVLVGDPDQLPPVVQDGEARALGLDKSLFERLDGQNATSELSLQYRMNREIMRMSNELIYGGRLVCGSDAVGDAMLHVPALSTALERVVSCVPEWMRKCFDQKEEVTWLDTSLVDEAVEVSRSGVSNEEEASIVVVLVSLFVKAGIAADNIGVISPFRSQVSLLKKRLHSLQMSSINDSSSIGQVEVNTIDQYQGRDKEVVLVSFSSRKRKESTTHEVKGTEILSDKRRLNVALTRGKFKVILIGNVSYLTSYEPIRCLLKDILRPNQIAEVKCIEEVQEAFEEVLRCQ